MIHLVNVHLPDPIAGADQLAFHFPRQIATVEKSERPEIEDQRDAVLVIAGVIRFGGALAADRIRCRGPWRGNKFLFRRYATQRESLVAELYLQWNPVARMQHVPL